MIELSACGDDTGWDFNNSIANESRLKPLCQQVEKHFQFPAHKLYRYFATADDEYLTEQIGLYYRGVHIPTSGKDDVCRYLQDRCLPPGGAKGYDNLIYIRNSTCLDPAGCVITYAHELHHIVQHGRFPKLMQANAVLRANLRTFEPTATEIDLPAEVEANIISKQIAEVVCGADPVRDFAEEQVRRMNLAGVAAQAVRWEFFLNVLTSTVYDFVDNTLTLVQKYKAHLNFGMDVNEPEWWVGPLEQDGSSRLAGTY